MVTPAQGAVYGGRPARRPQLVGDWRGRRGEYQSLLEQPWTYSWVWFSSRLVLNDVHKNIDFSCCETIVVLFYFYISPTRPSKYCSAGLNPTNDIDFYVSCLIFYIHVFLSLVSVVQFKYVAT